MFIFYICWYYYRENLESLLFFSGFKSHCDLLKSIEIINGKNIEKDLKLEAYYAQPDLSNTGS